MKREFYPHHGAKGSEEGEFAWEPPTDFTEYAVPEFPIESLPDELRFYVQDLATTHQVPIDIPALAALGVLSASVARKAAVKVGETHIEPLNLYLAPTAASGERKSVIRYLAAPLLAVEREQLESAAPEILKAQTNRAMTEQRIAKLERDAAKEDESAERGRITKEICELRERLINVPARPQLVADDVTPEYLGKLLSDQDERIAVISEEAGTFFAQVGGRYSRSGDSDLDLVLKAYDGASCRTGRISREPVILHSPALTIVVTPQPSVIDGLGLIPEFRGRGFLARWLMALPASLVGSRMYKNRAPDEHIGAAYAHAIKELARLPVPSHDQIPVLRIEGDALSAWTTFHDKYELEQAEAGRLEFMKDWAGKLGGKVARIAGCFHFLDNRRDDQPWAQPVSEKNILRAWTLGEFFLEHALAVYARLGANPDVEKARRLLVWIRGEHLTRFSRRECHQALRSLGEACKFDPWLGILVDRGFIRVLPRQSAGPKGGRPPSPMFEVNPFTQNPRNPTDPPTQSTPGGFEGSKGCEDAAAP